MRTLLPIAIALMLPVACATPAQTVRVDPVVAGTVFASAADQVQRCYRAPRVASIGKQIVTRLGVHLNLDGSLAELPVVLGQMGVTDENKAYAEPMAEAATLAVIRCAPLHLPSEHYGAIWSNFELRFSPRRAA